MHERKGVHSIGLLTNCNLFLTQLKLLEIEILSMSVISQYHSYSQIVSRSNILRMESRFPVIHIIIITKKLNQTETHKTPIHRQSVVYHLCSQSLINTTFHASILDKSRSYVILIIYRTRQSFGKDDHEANWTRSFPIKQLKAGGM